MSEQRIEGVLPRREIKWYVRYCMQHGLTARQAWQKAHKRFLQSKRLPPDWKWDINVK